MTSKMSYVPLYHLGTGRRWATAVNVEAEGHRLGSVERKVLTGWAARSCCNWGGDSESSSANSATGSREGSGIISTDPARGAGPAWGSCPPSPIRGAESFGIFWRSLRLSGEAAFKEVAIIFLTESFDVEVSEILRMKLTDLLLSLLCYAFLPVGVIWHDKVDLDLGDLRLLCDVGDGGRVEVPFAFRRRF
jgi:hypothetical protein